MGVQAKISSKGQITLPKEIRESENLKDGDLVEFVRIEGRWTLFPKNVSIKELFGVLGPPPSGKSLTIEEIDDAIADAVSEDDRRIVREWKEQGK